MTAAESGHDTLQDAGIIGRVALGDLIRRSAAKYRDKTAIIEGERRTSYAELNAGANRIARLLLQKGLRHGDKVLTLCENSTEFLTLIFGINKAGLVWVPVNTMLGMDDVSYIVSHSESKFAVVDPAILARPSMGDLLARLPHGFALTLPGAPGMEDIGSAAATLSPSEPEVEIRDRDLAQIMYTSGTTSRPKGVMHSHLSVYFAILGNVIEMEATRKDVANCMLPLYHCAQHCIGTAFLAAGATLIVMRGFDAEALLSAIDRHRITYLWALPAMYAQLIDHPRRKTCDLSSLRLCLYSMAPMPQTLLRRLIQEFCPNFALASGQTEMYPFTTSFRPEEQLRRVGNYWGEPSIVNDLAIMDEDGRLVPQGAVGEIVHRGPNVMLGYFKDPQATAETRRFGWHHTGDLGMIDADGQLMFVDRKKDMIKTGGENVPSVKVEEVLMRHPAVERAAAVGLPHPKWVEAVTAFVVLRAGASATEAELIEHCRKFLGAFEVPKAARFIEALPLTATGKIRKQALKERYRSLFEYSAESEARSAPPQSQGRP